MSRDHKKMKRVVAFGGLLLVGATAFQPSMVHNPNLSLEKELYSGGFTTIFNECVAIEDMIDAAASDHSGGLVDMESDIATLLDTSTTNVIDNALKPAHEGLKGSLADMASLFGSSDDSDDTADNTVHGMLEDVLFNVELARRAELRAQRIRLAQHGAQSGTAQA